MLLALGYAIASPNLTYSSILAVSRAVEELAALAIAQAIVQAHQGSLTLASVLGQGSILTIKLRLEGH